MQISDVTNLLSYHLFDSNSNLNYHIKVSRNVLKHPISGHHAGISFTLYT